MAENFPNLKKGKHRYWIGTRSTGGPKQDESKQIYTKTHHD